VAPFISDEESPALRVEVDFDLLSLLKNASGVGIGHQMIVVEFMSGPYIADVCDRGE
jgi:hypothetical protein